MLVSYLIFINYSNKAQSIKESQSITIDSSIPAFYVPNGISYFLDDLHL